VDSYFQRNGYQALDGKCGAQCFDGVCVKDGKVYISEVKPMGADGSIQLNGPSSTTNLPAQMTDGWIRNRAQYLKDFGSPEQVRTGNLVLQALDQKNIVRVVTGVNSSGATMVKVPGI
jgi:filamentous hemagglutinin